MKRLLFILCIIILISCTNTSNTSNKEVEESICISSKRINIENIGCYLYQFEYEGHQYITTSRCRVLIHLPSCPCHNHSSLSDL